MVWHKVITRGRFYERERDVPRIRAAFDVLAARCRRWPAPIDLLEAMPRIEQPHIGKLPHLASDDTRRGEMTKIKDLLRVSNDKVGESPIFQEDVTRAG